MNNTILSIIGNTPLVRLTTMFRPDLHVYAKLELLNPGGSAKDRPAMRIISEAWREGKIGPGSVVVESSSGNMAISMASICARYGLRFICVIDPKTSASNVQILKSFGAEISRVEEPDADTGEFLPARLTRVQELLAAIPNSYWPNQYGNENNYLAHYEGTMKEIVQQLGSVDYVFGAVSTCGTMHGCAAYVRDHRLSTKLIAVDAVGSVIFGGKKEFRRFPGIGAGIVPPFAQTRFMDRIVKVSDRDMVIGCRRLVAEESILAGPSSGAVAMALARIEQELPGGAVCVVIVHDRGERYLDTVYCDEWVEQQFGELPS
ncbi:2,3-diaminopropionate biosynthesis protein SbnA [Paenibacillus chartarius]|uniref:N-(2-amino-2-carboxyethyl)-L-glutamate synthase n=1 Tax=Paenibacillus chartarius TaxID=747481 RepID=A0ABV6DR65_9BACL